MEHEIQDTTRELPSFGPIRQWRLCLRVGETEKRRTLQQGASLVLGSSDLADLHVPDPTVSGRHCQVVAEPHGLRVVDLGSKNGTFVGAGRISEVLLQGTRCAFSLGRASVEVLEYQVLRDVDAMGMIGQAPSMQRLREQIRSFAPLRKPVLILGESGTGKDVVARALHQHSARRGSYVETNVAAYPDALLDAELFGHERGAFTGAVSSRVGLFEEAHTGTLFLDEIAELSRVGQAKLLRVVEDGKVRALGQTGARKVDVRLITATCRDLPQMIADDTFRHDLFHRISLLTIELPPLRKRLTDIPALASYYLSQITDDVGKKYLVPAALDVLMEHDWPGNVRELFAVLYQAAALSPGDEVGPGLLRVHTGLRRGPKARLYPERAVELMAVHESVSAAARAAGVPRSTFRSILERAKKPDEQHHGH